MTTPTATYRLQFRNGMDFARTAALAGYLARLGVSHLYASPLFAATPGSTHGYDGVDFAAMDPALGGEAGFEDLSHALDQAGLSLLLDFVPNHMAAADGNRWWQAVLEWGVEDPHASKFDIDWSAPKLLLPILDVPYSEAVRDDILGLQFDPERGSFALTCYDHHLPLTPPSYARLLARVADSAVADLADAFAATSVDWADALKQRLAALAAKPGIETAINATLSAAGSDPDALHEIHEAQIWRLTHWRLGREALTYRRFFEIAELIGLRVEDPVVFDAIHARLLELIATGRIAGVRVDHIDGLADPKAYLERLQRAASQASPLYLLVEKILEPDEALPPDWPVAGTTGYEFIAALAGLFVDRERESEMRQAYQGFTGDSAPYGKAARACKREIFEHNLAAELSVLTDAAQAIAARSIRTRDLGPDSLRRAIVELAAALPVYRTYVDSTGPDAHDRALIEQAATSAKASRNVENASAIDFIARLLRLDVDDSADRDAALAFTTRFQQTSGPVMAKGIEDTLFYRHNCLIALNEVGGAPDRYGMPLSAFHEAMAARRRRQPAGLSATGTHDTKRGEDARARLYVLSEMPDAWRRAVARWAALNAPHRTELASGPAPEPAMEWLFYQALAGAWPCGLSSTDEPGLAALRARMLAYMEKAVREAKLRTSWTNPDVPYEKAISAFITGALSRNTGEEFLSDFEDTCRPVWRAGAINSLAQLAIKLAAPGVPDIYQGAELWDFSLVDPDNRTPVDFGIRQHLLEAVVDAEPQALLGDWATGAPKLALTAAGLRLRRERPALFASGSYLPLSSVGDGARHVVAFARLLDDAFVVVIAPRFVLALTEGADRPLVPPDRWGDTAVALPESLRSRQMRDALTSAVHEAGSSLRLAEALRHMPVALLADRGHEPSGSPCRRPGPTL